MSTRRSGSPTAGGSGLPLGGNPVGFVLLFLALPYFRAAHFYLVHRLMHWKPLYKAAHYVHHRNVNVGPWSGILTHPIESELHSK